MLMRICSLVIKEFIHLRNDWWLPTFMLLLGAVDLLLIAYAIGGPITNLPLMVLDQSRSAASHQIVTAFENTHTFQTAQQVSNMQTIEEALNRGQINAAVVIPPDFAEQMDSSNGQPTLFVILNGGENAAASESLRAVQGIAQSIDENLVIQRLGLNPGEFSGFIPSIRVRFNQALSKALYTSPAELGLVLEFTILLLAALAFSRERELGTLEQLLVMPFSSLEIILGKSVPAVLIGFTDFLIMLALEHFVFDVPVRGSLLLLLILAFEYLLVELGKGLVISVISRTQQQAFLLVVLVILTDFMFTGFTAPVESMPPALQWFAYLIPANHWVTFLRVILLKGAGLDILWPHVVALLLLGLIIGAVTLRFVRRALD